MINENFSIPKREGQVFDPLPENVYQVELLDIEVQEKPKYKQPDQVENVFSFQFTLLNGKDKKGESLRGRNIWLNFVPTYLYIGKNGKNKLFQIIEAMLRRELTQEEEATMEAVKLNKLIGKQCRVVVKNKAGKDNAVFSNIDSLLPFEFPIAGLTEEEKEKARVKNKSAEEHETVREDEYSQAGHVEDTYQEEEIRVDQIPF